MKQRITKYVIKPIAIFSGIILAIGLMNPSSHTSQKAQIVDVDNKSIEKVAPSIVSPTLFPSPMIQSTIVPSPTMTIAPVKKPLFTPVPTKKYIAPTAKPIVYPTAVVQVDTAPAQSGYACNCAKTCPQLTCSEAQYQLNSCGCSVRDRDNDGIACDAQCQ